MHNFWGSSFELSPQRDEYVVYVVSMFMLRQRNGQRYSNESKVDVSSTARRVRDVNHANKAIKRTVTPRPSDNVKVQIPTDLRKLLDDDRHAEAQCEGYTANS